MGRQQACPQAVSTSTCSEEKGSKQTGHKLNVSTTVVMAAISEIINRDVVLNCLECPSQPTALRYLGPQETPVENVPEASIMSLSDKGLSRGMLADDVLRTYRGRYLRNMLSMYIFARGRRINIKVCKRVIHICGLTSDKEINYVSDLVIGKLQGLNVELQHINNLPHTTYNRTFQFLNHFRGPETTRYEQGITEVFIPVLIWERDVTGHTKKTKRNDMHTNHQPDITIAVEVAVNGGTPKSIMVHTNSIRWLSQQPGVLKRTKKKLVTLSYEDYLTTTVTDHHVLPWPTIAMSIPVGVDPTLLRVLKRIHYRNMLFGPWMRLCHKLLGSILTSERPVLRPFENILARGGGTIPFPIVRKNVWRLFKKIPNYVSHYDDTEQQYVSVTEPFKIGDSVRIRRKKKVHGILFMIYKSSKVIVSGPAACVNQAAYEKFIGLLEASRDEVLGQVDTTPRKRRKVSASSKHAVSM